MLELATKQRKHIANRLGIQGCSQQQMSKLFGYSTKFPNAKIRTENTDMYNCHGLVFATRRTNIYDPLEIQEIIKQDNYEEIDIKKFFQVIL
jgi:hypothetical protein